MSTTPKNLKTRVESGQSQEGDFPVPGRAGRADVDWGIGTKVMIGISALVSVMCAVVGIELVRTMWLWTQPSDEAHVSQYSADDWRCVLDVSRGQGPAA